MFCGFLELSAYNFLYSVQPLLGSRSVYLSGFIAGQLIIAAYCKTVTSYLYICPDS